jgi:hypothetical protein
MKIHLFVENYRPINREAPLQVLDQLKGDIAGHIAGMPLPRTLALVKGIWRPGRYILSVHTRPVQEPHFTALELDALHTGVFDLAASVSKGMKR